MRTQLALILVFFMAAAAAVDYKANLAVGLYTAAAAAVTAAPLVRFLFSAVPVALVVVLLPEALVFNPVAVAAQVLPLTKMAALALLVKLS